MLGLLIAATVIAPIMTVFVNKIFIVKAKIKVLQINNNRNSGLTVLAFSGLCSVKK